MKRPPVRLVLVLGLPHAVARAQATQAQLTELPVAHDWIAHELSTQERVDTFWRFAAAPAVSLLGGLALAVPALADVGPAMSASYLTGGALLLTGAVGMWAQPDHPYAASRWFSTLTNLGMITVGLGTLLRCLDDAGPCEQQRPLSRRLLIGGSISAIGTIASALIASLTMPGPDPQAGRDQVRALPQEQRDARVLAYLERKERAQRGATYAMLPWALGFSGWLAIDQAIAPDGRLYLSVLGGALFAVELGLALYELLLEEPASSKLRAGGYSASAVGLQRHQRFRGVGICRVLPAAGRAWRSQSPLAMTSWWRTRWSYSSTMSPAASIRVAEALCVRARSRP